MFDSLPRLAAVVGLLSLAAACGGSDEATETSPPTPPISEGSGSGPRRIAYASHDDGFGDLWLPDAGASSARSPVVVLIHGGFWRDGFFLDLMDPLVPSLLDRGFAVWNIEYRRVGAGGGHPETFDDVASAVDALAGLPDEAQARLDLDQVATVGHSAGGHLAVWSASRSFLSGDAVGAGPVIRPTLAVSQAGVLDLESCARNGVGGTACTDLIGVDPASDPERLGQTSPAEMLPTPVSVVAVHGDLDRIVPPDQSIAYVERAVAAGTDARLEVIEGADHFSHLDPNHSAWLAVLDALEAWRS